VARGRKPDPTRARRGTGHRAKSPAKVKPAREPAALLLADAQGPPEPPAELEHPHAIAVWKAVVAELYPRGLRPVDLISIGMLARQAALAHDAAAYVEGEGLMVRGERGGMIANPAVRVERDAANLYLRFAERFGLDVASRMRLGLMQLTGQTLADALQDDLERE
jgi:P27 family predicted phage terminase small subunit